MMVHRFTGRHKPASFPDAMKGQKRKQVPAQLPGDGEAEQPSVKVQKSRKKRRKADGSNLQALKQNPSEGEPSSSVPIQPIPAGSSSGGTDEKRQYAALKKAKRKRKKAALLDADAQAARPDGDEAKEGSAAPQEDPPRKKKSRNKFKPDVAPLQQPHHLKEKPAANQQSTTQHPEPGGVPCSVPESDKAPETSPGQPTGKRSSREAPATKQQSKAQAPDLKAAGKRGAEDRPRQRAAELSGPSAKHKQGGLLEQMRAKLSGGRFRWLNEQLYTCPGEQALTLMKEQPHLFKQYHEVITHAISMQRMSMVLRTFARLLLVVVRLGQPPCHCILQAGSYFGSRLVGDG